MKLTWWDERMCVQQVRHKHPNTIGSEKRNSITHCCLSCKLTVVFIMPVPWVRMELAMWRMLMVFKCLLLLAFSIKICWKAKAVLDAQTAAWRQWRWIWELWGSPGCWGYRGTVRQKHECSSWSPEHPNPDENKHRGSRQSNITSLLKNSTSHDVQPHRPAPVSGWAGGPLSL